MKAQLCFALIALTLQMQVQAPTTGTFPPKPIPCKYHLCKKGTSCVMLHGSPTCVDDCLWCPDAGLCKAYFPRWYYDALSGECKQFIYGGCDGNGNNFQTEKACYLACSK